MVPFLLVELVVFVLFSLLLLWFLQFGKLVERVQCTQDFPPFLCSVCSVGFFFTSIRLGEGTLKTGTIFVYLLLYSQSLGFPGGSVGKESACNARFDPWIGKIPWSRKWQPTPVLLPGVSHGQRSLVGYSPWGHKESDTTERLSFSEPSYLEDISVNNCWVTLLQNMCVF